MPIEWNENIRTGISAIDEQHQEGAVIMSRLGRLKCGRKDFLTAFSELKDYVDIHFKTEEDIMISMNYPEYKEHKSAHDNFVKNIKALKGKICGYEDISALCDEFYDFVQDWVLKHYSGEDVKLAGYIKEHP